MQRALGYLIVTFLFATVWVTAQVVLNEFQPGTVILSEDVNENFTALADELATKQARITGACPTGSSIRVVNADGTVDCEAGHGGIDPSKVTLVTEPNVVASGLQGSSNLAAVCDVGQLAIGGGMFVSGSVDKSQVAYATSRPAPNDRRRWEGEVRWTSASTEDRTVFIYAVCVSP